MKHLAIVAALLAVFLYFACPYISPRPYSYDEADYMYAAERGLIANYLDIPSYSFPEYVRIGMNRGTDPGQSSALSQAVRRAGDIFFYRHAHGPVYFYWLNTVSHWSKDEHFVRSLGLVFPIVTGLLIYFGCLWILPAPQSQLAGIIGCALYMWSPAVIRTSEVAPHQMFTMWFIVTLLLLAKLLATGERVFWYSAVAVTALAFCTLEVTFVLIAIVLLCGYLERHRLAMDWRFAGISAALFSAIVVAVYPATITRMAFAKSYLYYAYLSVKRKGPWGDVTFWDTWSERFSNSPVQWALVAIALFLWLRRRDLPGWRQALPFLAFGALMLATMLRVFTVGVRYVLPFLPALLVFAAVVISGALMRFRSAGRWALTGGVCAAVLLTTTLYVAAHPVRPDPNEFRLLSEIRDQHLESARLLAPRDALPTLHYYFPNAEVTGYMDELSLPGGQYDAIVRATEPVRVDVLKR